MDIIKRDFGATRENTLVDLYTLKNKNGMEVDIITYGGAVRSIRIPTSNGIVDVALGFDSIADYENHDKYMGAIIGRFANRIGGGEFILNNRAYKLACNNGVNHLHGGINGFDKKVWDSEIDDEGLILTYLSPNMEEGYPSDLATRVLYALNDDNELIIKINAVSNEDTIINITNHTYFNLSGYNSGSILDHSLVIFSDEFLENDNTSLPTGNILSVSNTPFDFRKPYTIGSRINDNDTQLKYGNGYDNCYIVNKERVNPLRLTARAYSKATGIMLSVLTTQCGLQFYSGNFLDTKVLGKNGALYHKNYGFALEAQGLPNSPRIEKFPSPILKSGEVYNQEIVYKFNYR